MTTIKQRSKVIIEILEECAAELEEAREEFRSAKQSHDAAKQQLKEAMERTYKALTGDDLFKRGPGRPPQAEQHEL